MAIIKCPECGKEISDMAQSCPNCGRPLQPIGKNIVQNQNAAPSQKPKKKGHGCLVTILIFIFLAIVVCFGVQGGKNGESQNNSSISQKYIDVSEEEGQKIDEILSQCGIEKIESIESDASLNDMDFEGEKGYRISANGINNIILYLNTNNQVFKIRYADHDLYSDNSIVASIKDYTLTLDEISKWQSMCQNKIKELLKAPSTAKFPNYTEWGFGKEENVLVVQGYVDAENSFGADIRSEFQFIIDTDTNTILSLIFDGEELMQ